MRITVQNVHDVECLNIETPLRGVGSLLVTSGHKHVADPLRTNQKRALHVPPNVENTLLKNVQ